VANQGITDGQKLDWNRRTFLKLFDGFNQEYAHLSFQMLPYFVRVLLRIPVLNALLTPARF